MCFKGFCRNFKTNTEHFICPVCGPTPAYIVADGKVMGPTAGKTAHLRETGRAPGDDQTLPQGSFFKDRLFLPEAEERTFVRY